MDAQAEPVARTQLRRLAVSALLYASLLFSSALQFTLGPEAVLRVAGYYTADPASRDDHFRRLHPDFAALAAAPAARAALERGADWKFTSIWADAAYYVAQVSRLDDSIPPYKYRFVPTALVRAVVAVTGLRVEHAFIVVNSVACLTTALLFELFMLRFFRCHAVLALLGGCLVITSASITGTVGLPMLEPCSALLSLLIFVSVAYGHAPGFIVASVLGVFTKEVLAISALLWLLAAPREHRPVWAQLAIAAVPLLAFSAARLALGGAALEVNYGYDLLRGELPAYGKRLFEWRGFAAVALQVFLSFSFLWIGLLEARRHPFLRRCLPTVPVAILAAVLLSSRLTRVLGIVFPVVIPGFLLWLDRMRSPEPAE